MSVKISFGKLEIASLIFSKKSRWFAPKNPLTKIMDKFAGDKQFCFLDPCFIVWTF